MSDYSYSEKDKFVQLVAGDDFHERVAAVKGDAWREYRRQWDAAGRFELETAVPLQVDFELSTFCNYKCPMCPFGVPKGDRPPNFDAFQGFFPAALIRKVLDEGVPLGVRAVDFSYYNEPLLRKDLMELIGHASKAGVLDIMMSTNAELLTPALSDRLLDSGLTRLMVSLDAATQETFQQIRVGGHFEVVMRNLEYLLEEKQRRQQSLPITRVSFVKTRLNELELQDFVAYWKPKVDYLSLQELIEFDQMRPLRSSLQIKNLDFRCHQPWHRLTLRANGDALPCCTIWGQQLVVGNVTHQSLAEIWTSEAMTTLRTLHKEGRFYDNPVCLRCAESSVA